MNRQNILIRGKRDSRQAGTSLVEVLITVVLLSIGLLGLAGLQLSSVKNTSSATERFEATILAKDILERMRANRRQARDGAYDIALGANAVAGSVVGDDLVEWKSALQALPGGDGAVDVLNGIATITVQWTDASDDNVDDSRTSNVLLRTALE